MARVVEAVQIFKKVEDVTAAKDDLSPVYLMDELADMARGSAECSEKIADRIAKRLQNKSPVVKFKALRLVRHLINKGCGQFQRSMQRHANLVREHVHFKGEPDPFKGDTPSQRVRDAAKEAAESLFNTVMAQPVTSLGGRIQGFGSSAAPPPSSNNSSSGPASSVSVSGSRIVGFGSSNYSGPNAPTSGNGSAGSGGSSFSQKGVNRPLTGSYSNANATASGTAANSVGGSGTGGSYTAPAVVASEVLGSELQLVESICTPGGLRLAPDPEDLRRFIEAAGNLDGLKLAKLLRDKMDASGPWQQQLRALYALEAVLLQGATQACGEIAVMFQSDTGPIQTATGHTQPHVRERASRVLKLLLGQDAPAATTPAASTQAALAVSAPRQTTADLLGGLDMLGSSAQSKLSSQQQQIQQQQRQTQQAGANTSAADDIFSGLALRNGTGTSPQQAYQATAGPSAQPSPGQPRPQQQQQAGAAASAPGLVTDPFDIMQPSTAPPPQVAYGQQQQPPQWQHQQQRLPVKQAFMSHQAYGAHPVAGSGVGLGHSHMVGTSMRTGASEQLIAQLGNAAAQPPQASGERPPLDDMFADMSLSGNPLVGGPGQTVGAGSMYGGVGPNAYGAVGPAYGGGGIGGGFMGYGNQDGAVGPGASQMPMSMPSNSGVAVGMAPLPGSSQFPARQGTAGMGGGAIPHPSVQQQQLVPQPVAPMHPMTVGGRIDTFGVGPSVSGTTLGTGAGGYGAAAGGGVGPAGGGPYPGNSHTALGGLGAGVGLAHGAGGGSAGEMMVGPGGQVRYMGSSVQPSSMKAPMGNMGPANGQLQQHSWQPPYAVQHQYQQSFVSGGLNTQQLQHDKRGGAAFDFVREQFK